MEVNEVYQSARKAQQNWQDLSVRERLAYFTDFRKNLAKKGGDLALLIKESTGKPTYEALTAEILTVLTTLSYWERKAVKQLKQKKTTTPWLLWGRRSWIEYHPVGVVLIIAPWNYPLQLTLIPALSALLAGNAVIIKPSEVTSDLDQHLLDLFADANFPQDLVQVISGDGEVGAALVQGEPDLILFTGSVSTGKKIQQEAAKRLIPTILELGGKDALIVLDDAPLKRAVQGALWGSFTNSGQVCLGTERIYVHKDIYDDFLQAFVQEAKEVKLGQMTWPNQTKIVQEQVQDALAKGARLIVGDLSENENENEKLPPLVFVDTNNHMLVAREESFGPIVSISPFSQEDEVVHLVNDSNYGLGASVWSTDLARARALGSRLNVGNVSINDTMITIANPDLPFGGLKYSGLGSYRGRDGLQKFCTPRAFMESKGKTSSELNWFPYTVEKEELINTLIENVYGDPNRWWQVLGKALNPNLWRKNRNSR